jgi:hypothetical protein
VPDGLVIKRLDGPIVLVRFGHIRRVSATGLGKDYITSGANLSIDSERYRLISHFPHGMNESVRSRLLTQAGQTQVMVVE